jgi:hypothetical protein
MPPYLLSTVNPQWMTTVAGSRYPGRRLPNDEDTQLVGVRTMLWSWTRRSRTFIAHLKKLDYTGGKRSKKGPDGEESVKEYVDTRVDALFKTDLFRLHLPLNMALETFRSVSLQYGPH